MTTIEPTLNAIRTASPFLNPVHPIAQDSLAHSEALRETASHLMYGKTLPDSFLKAETCTFQPHDPVVEPRLTPEQLQQDYFRMLKEISPCADTLEMVHDTRCPWEKISPEIVVQKREEFNEIKPDLKSQWEEIHGVEWPKYREDVYSDNGNLIRKAGNDYDAHHIRPLCLGGENLADNITPLHAKDHYDKQGVHASETPYDQLTKIQH